MLYGLETDHLSISHGKAYGILKTSVSAIEIGKYQRLFFISLNMLSVNGETPKSESSFSPEFTRFDLTQQSKYQDVDESMTLKSCTFPKSFFLPANCELAHFLYPIHAPHHRFSSLSVSFSSDVTSFSSNKARSRFVRLNSSSSLYLRAMSLTRC